MFLLKLIQSVLIQICCIFTISVVNVGGSENEVTLDLQSDSPAVLDAPIRFTGKLSHADFEVTRDLKWRWTDNTVPFHFEEFTGTSATLTATYETTYSSKLYEARDDYFMTLTVFIKDQYFGFWQELSKNTVQFSITQSLNGKLRILSSHYADSYVSTESVTEIGVEFYDPHHYLKNATAIHYFWIINETPYGQSENGSFVRKYEDPGLVNVEATVMAYFEGANGTVKNKFAFFNIELRVQKPLSNFKVTGDVWLKHGNLLDLTITCDGSGPWKYCTSMKDANYNITGNETCLTPRILTDVCSFPIYWYYREFGVHKILVILENEVSTITKLLVVTVYSVVPQTPLSIVILPIVSAIGAVIAVMSAVVLMIKFKRRLAIETADFDFSIRDDDDRLEYKTFWERLRDSMLNAFGNASSDDISHISSSSSNGSSVKPPVGIHYGSIS